MNIGQRLAGRYMLLETIGEGGMAVVWRAVDTRLGRDVAVKLLRPEMAADPSVAARFEEEARHAAALAHESVATVYDAGSDGGTAFIVMELVPGPSVARMLARLGALRPGQAVAIAAAVAGALDAAHQQGIVHRDVKPGNILVGVDGRVRLADFGIARAMAEARTTSSGMILGSLPYLSPRLLEGAGGGPEDDLYALGVVVFEMLTGALPLPAASPAALAAARHATQPPRPSSLAPTVPRDLDELVGRLMAPDPARRPRSAAEVRASLEAWRRSLPPEDALADEPRAAVLAMGPRSAWMVAATPGAQDVTATRAAVAQEPTVSPMGGALGTETLEEAPTTADTMPTAVTPPRTRVDRTAAAAALLLAAVISTIALASAPRDRVPDPVAVPAAATTTPVEAATISPDVPVPSASPRPAEEKVKPQPKGKGGPKDKPKHTPRSQRGG
jgi:serine/threonine-protein kinase